MRSETSADRRYSLPARHRTLRAAAHGSFELCSPAERVLWARVSIFAGSFDLAAVQAVSTDDPMSTDDAIDTVEALVNRSVLISEDHAGRTRYRMLETLREFGLERLSESGEEHTLRRRHRD
jgi:predicted ATPase